MPDAPWTRRASEYLWPRWMFLRALGLIFFSAFYSLAFQIRGLIGVRGVLPVGSYLAEVASAVPGMTRFWAVPSLFWIASGDRALDIAVGTGLVVSLLVVANVWPRVTIALATLLFTSCVTTLQDFSSYQSDGMLLEAGFISIFFAPGGVWPGLGRTDAPSWISLWLLRWEWFRIYFESGVVKLASGDPHWRHLTAMDDYYQNGPLPAWPGWYIQHLPHWYHAGTALFTLVVELGLVWLVFMPRRLRPLRLGMAAVVTALQIGIIATANYAFLNYLVLVLGVLLLDDEFIARFSGLGALKGRFSGLGARDSGTSSAKSPSTEAREPRTEHRAPSTEHRAPTTESRAPIWAWFSAAILAWIFYATIVAFLTPGSTSIFAAPEHALEPFRIANAYGLFATMTPARYEIEFQGTRDSGATWLPYPFRYKPQDPMERPGIYAPYQPRFEWNLWFASLGSWRESPWVVNAQARLLEGSPSVLALFRRDPFNGAPPQAVRTVLWQYWFTDWETKRKTGAWWRRTELGLFSGVLTKEPDGKMVLTKSP